MVGFPASLAWEGGPAFSWLSSCSSEATSRGWPEALPVGDGEGGRILEDGKWSRSSGCWMRTLTLFAYSRSRSLFLQASGEAEGEADGEAAGKRRGRRKAGQRNRARRKGTLDRATSLPFGRDGALAKFELREPLGELSVTQKWVSALEAVAPVQQSGGRRPTLQARRASPPPRLSRAVDLVGGLVQRSRPVIGVQASCQTRPTVAQPPVGQAPAAPRRARAAALSRRRALGVS